MLLTLTMLSAVRSVACRLSPAACRLPPVACRLPPALTLASL